MIAVTRVGFLLALGGAAILRAFFVALRTQWPLSYFAIGTLVDPIIRRSMTRYILFRAGPVFLASLFVAVTSDRWNNDTSATFVVSALIAMHLLNTYGLALVRAGRARHLDTRLGLFWIASAVLVIASGAIALPLRRTLRSLVPQPSEMVSALWTGLFATAVAVAVVQTMRSGPVDLGPLLARSSSEIDSDLVDYAKQACEASDADIELVRAVMLVENLQRPGWVRRAERIKGRVFNKGSYGIMQVESNHPIDDRRSIDLAMERFFKNSAGPPGEPRWDVAVRQRPIIESYNSNRDFVDMVMEARQQGSLFSI
jgi:hypothetical protein